MSAFSTHDGWEHLRLEEVQKLGVIKSVAWHTIIDDTTQLADILWVRFEDENGYVVDFPYRDYDNHIEYYLLNLVFSKLWQQVGLIPDQWWFITHGDFIKAVNKARAIKPYQGKHHINEHDILYRSGWKAPEYIW